MTNEIKRIHKNIVAVYEGQPWYGDNILTKIQDVTALMATKIPENLNHSIAEIVCHMAAWRYFVIGKIKNNADYEVWETELDWREIRSLSEVEWAGVKEDLKNTQAELLRLISTIDEEKLNTIVDNRKYNYRLMLQGIVQHDIYHLGQISLLKKLVS